MEPLAIHHVSINVDDVDAALAFYVGLMGLRERGDRPDFGFGGAWLDIGGQQVHLIESEVPTAVGQHFAVLVADLDATVAELRQAGVTVSDPKPVGAALQAFLDDPAEPSASFVQLDGVAGRVALASSGPDIWVGWYGSPYEDDDRAVRRALCRRQGASRP
jgi:glyoxylase I family protein